MQNNNMHAEYANYHSACCHKSEQEVVQIEFDNKMHSPKGTPNYVIEKLVE